jgi:hypothetical protein
VKPKGRMQDDSEIQKRAATKGRLDKEGRGAEGASHRQPVTWAVGAGWGGRTTASKSSTTIDVRGALWHDWRSGVRGENPLPSRRRGKTATRR